MFKNTRQSSDQRFPIKENQSVTVIFLRRPVDALSLTLVLYVHIRIRVTTESTASNVPQVQADDDLTETRILRATAPLYYLRLVSIVTPSLFLLLHFRSVLLQYSTISVYGWMSVSKRSDSLRFTGFPLVRRINGD